MPTCTVSEYDCDAPAGFGIAGLGYADGTGTVGKTKCYICGQPVCKSCSQFIKWNGSRVRACESCVPFLHFPA